MMKKKLMTFVAIFIILCSNAGCTSWKRTLCSQGTWEDMIRNCISDFVYSNLAEKDSVFYIFDLEKEKRYDEISKYATLVINPEDNKIYAFPQDTVGAPWRPMFPTRYLIVNNKLFIWDDSNIPITQELILVYEKYKILDREWLIEELEIDSSELTPDLKVDFFIPSSYKFDDASVGAWYYIDKSDFTKYKRFIQSYEPNYNP